MKKKPVKSLKRLHNSGESGQATLEYILVLTVTVILILSLVWQFNSAFRKYAEAFFDGYISCLLETGELPGTGGDCAAEYQKFKIADGQVLGGGGGIGSGGSSGSGSNNSNSNSNGEGDSAKTAGRDGKNTIAKSGDGSGSGSSDSAGGGGGGELGGSGQSGSSVFIKGRSGKQRSTAVAGAKAAGAGSGKGREPLTAVGSGDVVSSGSGSSRRRKTALDRSYGFAGQETEEEKALTAPSTVVAKDDGSSSLKPKKVSVDMSRKPAAVVSNDQEGFSLGKFIRIIMIAGIVVLLFIFLGGQILQISKSGEK